MALKIQIFHFEVIMNLFRLVAQRELDDPLNDSIIVFGEKNSIVDLYLEIKDLKFRRILIYGMLGNLIFSSDSGVVFSENLLMIFYQ